MRQAHGIAPHFQWNHRVHEMWGQERLIFWRLAFSPTYDRDAVLSALRDVMKKNRVSSYVFYELAGVYDLLLRIWLPSSVTQEEFKRSLREHLGSTDLQVCDDFNVTQVVVHWVWDSEKTGDNCIPPPSVLNHCLSKQEIADIESGRLTQTQRLEFEKMNLIAPCDVESGITFITVIPPSIQYRSSRANDRLRDRLKGILLQAQHVHEASLYEGLGFGQFLLLGKVPHEHFFKINDEIIEEINNLNVQDFGVRTYTHIGCNPNFLDFQEHLSPIGQAGASLGKAPEQTINEVLNAEESESLEFKGSAFVDISRWVHSDESPLSDKITNEGVLKAIVGFLNGKGGKLVIGALEAKRFSDPSSAGKLAACPRVGSFICCGVDLELELAGAKDWDWFQLRLTDLINTRVIPSPLSFIRIERQEFEGRGLCVVSMHQGKSWFYLREDASKPLSLKFYVRQGNGTRELNGPDADLHKIEHPRGK